MQIQSSLRILPKKIDCDCDSCETKETKQQKHPCTYKDEFKYFTLGVL